jgi:hypothetical protein
MLEDECIRTEELNIRTESTLRKMENDSLEDELKSVEGKHGSL